MASAGGDGSTRIMKCSCSHDFQDKKYGKNMRLMNPCKKGESYRCTVCAKEYSSGKQLIIPAIAPLVDGKK